MAYDFIFLQKKIKDTNAWLAHECAGIRTGRAAPALLERIVVESYGSRLPLNQVASISVEDARTVRVAPWDASQAKHIEKAITGANLGVSVGADEKGVRVFFPELTAERRTSLLKLAHERLEQARVSLRGVRDDVWSDIQEKERTGAMSEDEKFRYKDEMQKLVDEASKELEALITKKEKEIGG